MGLPIGDSTPVSTQKNGATLVIVYTTGPQGFFCGRAQTPGPSGARLPWRAPVPMGFWWWFEIAFPQNFAVPPNDPRIVRENSDFSVSLRAFFEMKDPK